MTAEKNLTATPPPTCRVCASDQLTILPMGEYAAFFRLRVDVAKDLYLLYSRSGTITTRIPSLPARAIRKAKRLLHLQRVKQAQPFRTAMQFCAACHSLTPRHEYTFEDLHGLYRDYRKESYNRDRISVEPGYAAWAPHVGSHPLELKNRNAAVDAFLRRNADAFIGGAMIDYGGSDGRFLPPFALERFDSIHIFDASDAPPHPSVDARKVSKIAEPATGAYSFLVCMHVLEHVGNPRAMVADAVRLLRPGGLAYIEIPHDMSPSLHDDCQRRIVDSAVTIHEHLNSFDRMGMPALFASLGNIELLDAAEETADFGWTTALVGRFLFRKTM